jgi:hypothetical protein
MKDIFFGTCISPDCDAIRERALIRPSKAQLAWRPSQLGGKKNENAVGRGEYGYGVKNSLAGGGLARRGPRQGNISWQTT